MISITEIQQAIHKSQPVFEKIQCHYRQLPQTTCACKDPGICCAFLPEMTFMEALQWFRVMQQMRETEYLSLIHKFVSFYLTNPIQNNGCPFLSEGRCGIYEFRTFACRAYGLWSQSLGQERTRQSREGKRVLVKMWQHYGIELAPEAIATEMDYCEQVSCKSKPTNSDDQLMAILKEIYLLDNESTDLQHRFENEYHSDFSFLIASLALGAKKAVLGKFAVIKELSLEGTDKRLKKLLSHIKPDGIILKD